MGTREFNFDGLVGPSHNYAGLSYGNVASATHQHQTSHPRMAALQGLEKMKTLVGLGIGQAILPPLPRPDLSLLWRLGFRGKTDAELIQNAYRVSPQLVANSYSAANMWTANAATVSPSIDCQDGKLHLTPANLASTLHRSLEADPTAQNLRTIFDNRDHFTIHDPLPPIVALTDEGAANHTRLCERHDTRGIELFVYGADLFDPASTRPSKFPARQTRLASETIARHHGLNPEHCLFWQQTPAAIDAGVFHNDVISVGNQKVLLVHEYAFVDQTVKLRQLRDLYSSTVQSELYVIEFLAKELPLADAVRSYLFNSQLVTRPDGKMTLICPTECEQVASAFQATRRILDEDNPIDEIRFLDLRQSMNNGGGPACLRLRVVLTEQQAAAMHPGVILTEGLAEKLTELIHKFYRETLTPNDLADPQLAGETQTASEEIYRLLGMPTPKID